MFQYMLTILVQGSDAVFTYVSYEKSDLVQRVNTLRKSPMAAAWSAIIQLLDEDEDIVNGVRFNFNADGTRA